MVAIGPQLPPHLAKRKRTPGPESADSNSDSDSDSNDGYAASSPPSKKQARRDVDVNADADADADAGGSKDARTLPRLDAPSPPPVKPTIGPSLPPPNRDQIALDSEDDGSGPAAPALAPSVIKKRVIGPALPPVDLSAAPTNVDSDSDSDSDADFGPSENATALRPSRGHAPAPVTDPSDDPPSRRDEWMLVPPRPSDVRAPDPTRIRSRKFASGPRAGAGGGNNEIGSIWTETPEEKRRRLEDAVLGRERTAPGSTTSTKGARMSSKASDEDHTAQARGRSMYEEHQRKRRNDGRDGGGGGGSGGGGGKKAREDDDPSARVFDKEKDMALGGRIGASQRRQLLHQAADFGGRFSKGSHS